MSGLHLTKDDNDTIAFVVAALFAGAIDVDELRAWADHALLQVDDPPYYLCELATFRGFVKDVYGVIGFFPDRDFRRADDLAFEGLVYLRGRVPGEPHLQPHRARIALARNPALLAEFRRTFPFLTVGDP